MIRNMRFRNLKRWSILCVAAFVLHLTLYLTTSSTAIAITPTPDLPPFETFPNNLWCSDIGGGPGPTWEGITIGRTTLPEMKDKLNDYEMTSFGDEVDFVLLSPESRTARVTACLRDNIVTLLKLDTIYRNDPLRIADLVASHGPPDVVTYDGSPFHRVALWVEQGLAAKIYIDTTHPAFFGGIDSIIYFPYQEINGYTERWPYNRVRKEWIPARETTVPNEPNPFNFDQMFATIIAQPSRTPTFTPTARLTQILIPSATLTPIPRK
jgi:hypothetical protein